jgi:hypothetical protein
MLVKAIVLLTAFLLLSATAAEQFRDVNERLPVFTLKGVPVGNAVLERAGLEEGIVRLETGGLLRIQLETLPEPARSKYYDQVAVAKAHAEKKAKVAATISAAQRREQEKKKQRDDAALAKAQELQRAVAKLNPIRLHEDAVYDFTDFLVERQKLIERVRWLLSGYVSESNAAEAKTIASRLQSTTPYYVSGKVVSVQKEGVLVRTHEEGPLEMVFVKNLPTADQLVDEEAVNACALPGGRYQYQAVNGSLKTIPLYDYGAAMTRSAISAYPIVRLVNQEGTEFRKASTQP